MEEGSLYNTIAEAVNSIWAKADQKLLDNAVKYTPEGGTVRVRVRPWHFYTRIDIEDTGIGSAKGTTVMCFSGFTEVGRRLLRRASDLDFTW